eukprot:2581561-Rhodomonas_salina.1
MRNRIAGTKLEFKGGVLRLILAWSDSRLVNATAVLPDLGADVRAECCCAECRWSALNETEIKRHNLVTKRKTVDTFRTSYGAGYEVQPS